MTINNIEFGVIKFCILGLLSACASTPEIDTNRSTGADFRDYVPEHNPQFRRSVSRSK